MTIWKMFTVGIKNCIRNWKISLLFGVLLSFLLSLLSSAPSDLLEFFTDNNYLYSAIMLLPFTLLFSIAISVLQPVLTTLPLLTAFTQPPQNGPQTFKGRFSLKFGPFLLLSLIWLGITFALMIVWAILLFAFSLTAGVFSAVYSFNPVFIVIVLILIIPLYFALLILSCASYYSYIALTTENIKATQALTQGFKMLSKHFGRSIGNSLVFSLIPGIIPAILVVTGSFLLAYERSFSMVTAGYWAGLALWLVGLILIHAAQVIYTAAMVELYRKNWLEDHNNPFGPLSNPVPGYVQNSSAPGNWSTSSQPIQHTVPPMGAPASSEPPFDREPTSATNEESTFTPATETFPSDDGISTVSAESTPAISSENALESPGGNPENP